jgi:hypothetical protein
MRWYFGYPVLALGLAFGAHTFFPSGPDDFHASRAAAKAAPETGRKPVVVLAPAGLASPSRVAAFSPGARFQVPVQPSAFDYFVSKIGLGSEPAAAAPTTAKTVVASPWKSAVIRAGDATQDSIAGGEAQRVALTRDIQRELKRVGCYGGVVDGVWGGGSRRAILTFMDRVNASLPTSEPDVFILSLLRAQDASVCSATCPSGQSMTQNGRCLPTAIVAQAGARGVLPVAAAPEPAQSSVVAEAQIPTTPRSGASLPDNDPAFSGRMSIGGPKPDGDALDAIAVARGTMPAPAAAPLAKTAALETVPADGALTGEGAAAPAAVAPDSFGSTPARVKSSSGGRPKQARATRSTYRHVQALFEHPLGRM